MTKEELLNGLKASLGNPDANGVYAQANISQRTLDVYADSVVPSLADVAYTDELGTAHANILKAMGGQLRHDVSQAIASYKKTQTQGVEVTPNTPQDGTPQQDADVTPNTQSTALDALLKEFEAQKQTLSDLQAKLTEQDNAAKQTEVRNAVMSVMREKGATNDYVIDVIMRGYQFDTTKSVEQLVEENLGRYNTEFTKAYGNSGAYPKTAVGSGDGKVANANREAFKKKMQNAGRLPKID